jgi:hypothetical protein
MTKAAAKSSFQEVIESVEVLPLDDQQILMDIIQITEDYEQLLSSSQSIINN